MFCGLKIIVEPPDFTLTEDRFQFLNCDDENLIEDLFTSLQAWQLRLRDHAAAVLAQAVRREKLVLVVGGRASKGDEVLVERG